MNRYTYHNLDRHLLSSVLSDNSDFILSELGSLRTASEPLPGGAIMLRATQKQAKEQLLSRYFLKRLFL